MPIKTKIMMRKYFSLTALASLLLCTLYTQAQTTPDQQLKNLIGKWELVRYSEQGVQVDKTQAALPQALKVYNYVRGQRARVWYGYDSDYSPDLSNRQRRNLERWAERDSTVEVNRVREAIEMPYFAVFFADSTLALYNKDPEDGSIHLPESRHFVFNPKSMSLDIFEASNYSGRPVQWQAQVLELSAEKMLLFLPEDGEIVELIKRPFILP